MRTKMSWLSILLLGLFLVTSGCKKVSEPTPDELGVILNKYQQQYNIPSLAGAVLSDGQSKVYATGLRKMGSAETISPEDLYFIGSNAKAMTSTMIAVLVEEGLLNWESKISDVFPEFIGQIPNDFKEINLTVLLNHHAGIAPFENVEDFIVVPQFSGDIKEQRHAFVKWVLNYSGGSSIGNYAYSNGGYVVAAAMAEKVTNKAWEDLIREKLFDPLQMTVVYGWPAEGGQSQPWGHTWEAGLYIPFNPDSSLQFPELFNPAGNISMNLTNFLKFVRLHVDGMNGSSSFLTASTFTRLHTPVDGCSLGWSESTHNGTPVSFHDGSDGTFYALMVIEHLRKKAVIVLTNCYSSSSVEAVNLASIELMDKID